MIYKKLAFQRNIQISRKYNHDQHNFSSKFLFTTSELEQDYHPLKKNVRVTSRVTKQLKTYDLRKLGNLK